MESVRLRGAQVIEMLRKIVLDCWYCVVFLKTDSQYPNSNLIPSAARPTNFSGTFPSKVLWICVSFLFEEVVNLYLYSEQCP